MIAAQRDGKGRSIMHGASGTTVLCTVLLVRAGRKRDLSPATHTRAHEWELLMVKETGEDRDRQLETYKAQRDRLVAELDSYRSGASTAAGTGKDRTDAISKLEREITQLEERIAQLEVELGKA